MKYFRFFLIDKILLSSRILNMNTWTTNENNIIINNYKDKMARELVHLLPNRTRQAIEQQIKKLGLKKGRGKFIRSLETRLKTRISARNRKYTPEGLAKIQKRLSISNKLNPPALGKKWKLTGQKLKSLQNRLKTNLIHLGHKHTQESKDKISKIKLERMTPELRKKNRESGLKGILAQSYKNGPTSIERKVMDYLVNNKIEYKFQHIIEKYSIDFYIPSVNTIIECDGLYWHSLPKTVAKDEIRDKYLSDLGFKIIRLKEEEIKNNEFMKKLNNLFNINQERSL
jgi:very-short-patch-repair endonuclease